LYVANYTGRFGLFRLAVRALFRRLNRAKDFDTICAKDIHVEMRRNWLRVAIDAEISVMTMPLRYRVLPAALSVIVPGARDAA
jgi:diacylglycerol kinase family enzyme